MIDCKIGNVDTTQTVARWMGKKKPANGNLWDTNRTWKPAFRSDELKNNFRILHYCLRAHTHTNRYRFILVNNLGFRYGDLMEKWFFNQNTPVFFLLGIMPFVNNIFFLTINTANKCEQTRNPWKWDKKHFICLKSAVIISIAIWEE